MARRSFSRTLFVTPVAVAAAMAAGLLTPISGMAQATPQKDATQLQRLLNEKDHRFSDVQLLKNRVSPAAPLQARPFVPGNQPAYVTSRPEAAPQQLLDRRSESMGAAQTTQARVVMPRVATNTVTGQFVASLPRVQQTSYQEDINTLGTTHQLQFVAMEAFEQKIVNLFGSQLRATTSEDGRYVRVMIPGSGNQPMTTLVDRKSGQLTYEGNDEQLARWNQLMQSIDRKAGQPAMIPIGFTRTVPTNRNSITQFTSTILPQEGGQEVPASLVPATGNQDQDDPNEQDVQIPGLRGTVKLVRGVDGRWSIVAEYPEDAQKVKNWMIQRAKERQDAQPKPDRISLKNVRGSEIEERVQEIYDDKYSGILGPASVFGTDTPNQLVLVGSPNAIKALKELVATLDVSEEIIPGEGFKTFNLKFISAADAESRLEEFFAQSGLTNAENTLPSDPTTVVSDFRSNQVTVRGSQQLIKTAEAFLKTIDVDQTAEGPINVVEVVKLRNSVASDIALVLQDAISGNLQNANQAFVATGNQQQQQQQQQNQNQQAGQSTLRSPQLVLTTIGKDGRRVETKGAIMFDVRVTADTNSNSLIVQGPRASMPLVLELIKQLDVIPDAETQLKVFELVHGDAQTVLGMLETLFGTGQNTGGQANQTTSLTQLPLQTASASQGNSIVNVRFSYEPRSNAIIASGPAGDLQVIEDLLNRLDAKALTHTNARVYRLSNAPALDVATAINAYLDAQNDLISNDPRTNQGVPGVNRTVIVQHDVVSNSLIVKALPEYRKEIEDIIRALDRRPPMVKVKTLIAEVDLTALEEFGVELGIQDSLLFDRGTTVSAAGAITGVGFPFATDAAGVVPNANAFARELVAGRAVTQLGVGSSQGLVLSAGNESLSLLMSALQEKQCLRVLSKPHITTLENLQGRVAIGAEVARPSGVTTAGLNVVQDITFTDVGVILEVTPRVSPDGMIILSVNAEKSSVGPDDTGTVIGFDNNNNPITTPQILKAVATTTLMARSGQTVVFSGLIDEEKSHIERGMPILSDLPVLGPLFKFESDTSSRSELLIIMTPYLINDDQDLANMNRDEMDRMHWCLSDVAEVYGNTDYAPFAGGVPGVETIYPDADPLGTSPMTPNTEVLQPAVLDSRLETPSQPRFSSEGASTAELETIGSEVKTADRKGRRGLFNRRR